MQTIIKLVGIFICLILVGAASSAEDAALNESYTYIFVQEGAGGSFVADGSGNYTLTVTDVIPYTIYFSDRPARDAGFAPMQNFTDGFNWDPSDPPNALIVLKEASDEEDMVVVELTDPQWDEANQTLTYTAKLIEDFGFESDWPQDLIENADLSIPEEFGRVAIVIDDCHCMYSDYSDCPSKWHDSCWNWITLMCVPDCGNCC